MSDMPSAQVLQQLVDQASSFDLLAGDWFERRFHNCGATVQSVTGFSESQHARSYLDAVQPFLQLKMSPAIGVFGSWP